MQPGPPGKGPWEQNVSVRPDDGDAMPGDHIHIHIAQSRITHHGVLLARTLSS